MVLIDPLSVFLETILPFLMYIQVYYNGYHGDTSETFMVGDVDAEGEVLLDVASACREAGIKVCGHGIPFSAIGSAIR